MNYRRRYCSGENEHPCKCCCSANDKVMKWIVKTFPFSLFETRSILQWKEEKKVWQDFHRHSSRIWFNWKSCRWQCGSNEKLAQLTLRHYVLSWWTCSIWDEPPQGIDRVTSAPACRHSPGMWRQSCTARFYTWDHQMACGERRMTREIGVKWRIVVVLILVGA